MHGCSLSVEAEAEHDTFEAGLVYIMRLYLSKQAGERVQP